jgi:YkoY family integral membrane protein
VHPFQTAHPSDLVTIALLVALEGLLSADNAIVLAVLALGLPEPQRRHALRYGLLGALTFRIAATLLAVYLIELAAVKIVGAAYLLYLVCRHFFGTSDIQDRRRPRQARPLMGLSAFWATVLKVELADAVFAVDSILVGVAMSRKAWVIISGGVLGIVMMRLVIGQLLSIVERYPPLVDAAFIVIAWVGGKLMLEFLHAAGYIAWEIPRWLSLGLIVLILAVALVYARSAERGRPDARAAAREWLQGRSGPPV